MYKLILLILFWSVLSFSQTQLDKKFSYSGSFLIGDFFADFCSETGCILGISGDVVNLPFVLNVQTNSPGQVFSAVKTSLLSSGYFLYGSPRGRVTISKDVLQDQAVFIDCENLIQQAPRAYLSMYKAADSLRCVQKNLVPVRQKSKWHLRYLEVSESLLKSYGLSVGHPLISFDFKSLDFNFLGGSLDYLRTRDSLMIYRDIYLDLDSIAKMSWGLQKQIQKTSLTSDGIISTSYEWRQYGMSVNLYSTPLRLEYEFRSQDESTLEGYASANEDSSIFVSGLYLSKSSGRNCFLPFFNLFCSVNYTTEFRRIILYAILEKKTHNYLEVRKWY